MDRITRAEDEDFVSLIRARENGREMKCIEFEGFMLEMKGFVGRIIIVKYQSGIYFGG